MLPSIGQALLSSTATSESTYVTDVLTKNYSPWDACTYVSYRAQGGCKIHPSRGRKSDFARRPDLSMRPLHDNFKDRRAS